MWLWLTRFQKRTSRPKYDYLEGAASFCRTIERERMRADRNFSLFSLVELRFDPPAGFEQHVPRLERILSDRLRATDVAGILSDRRIGLLLPDTPVKGAETVTRDVVSMWGARDPKLLWNITLYSAREFDDVEPPRNGSDSRRTSNDRRSQPVPVSGPGGGGALAGVFSFVRPLPLWKRTIDVVGASVGLVVLSPLLLLIGLLIWVTSGRPILFRQRRTGLGGRPFWIYKFRTMCTDAEVRKQELRPFSEQDGPAFKLKWDPRITPLGRYLRKSSIDELPQLWNVVKGEMTLVGPRPLPCDESAGCLPWQLRRLDVTPGLTCIWQVEGKSRVTFDEWIRMDLRYIRERTPWHDARLIARTALAVVAHRASH